jgi:medium-chain acyl-[acyl-carrier-protein] hydrolase
MPTRCDEYVVRSYETDPTGRLSPASLLRYLQETAWNHASALGLSLDPRQRGPLAWVLSRLRLRMSRYPGWGERVLVETWPVSVERMHALRDFLIRDGSGRECGRATTGWLIIDVASRRPQRPQHHMPALMSLEPREPLEGLPGRIEAAAPPCEEQNRQVLYSDIDINGHVNNVRYFEWVLDSQPTERLTGGEIRTIEAAYVAEALLGHSVAVRTTAGGNESRHTIVQLDDDSEVCRMRMVWQPRSEGA